MAQSRMCDGNTSKSPYFRVKCQMMWSRKIPAKGGNDPASGCRAPAGAMVVPALLAGQSQAKPYQFVSRADLKMIRIASHSGRGGRAVHGLGCCGNSERCHTSGLSRGTTLIL